MFRRRKTTAWMPGGPVVLAPADEPPLPPEGLLDIPGVRSPEEITAGIARAKEALEAGDEAVADYLTPLRPGENPLADQLIEETSRLRRERNDWMREAERLKRLVDAYEVHHSDGGDSGE